MNRAVNRLIARFALLGVAIVLGVLAVAHTQKGLEKQRGIAGGATTEAAFVESSGALPLTSGANSGMPPVIPQPISADFAADPLPSLPAVDETNSGYPPPLSTVEDDSNTPPALSASSVDPFAEAPSTVQPVQAELPTAADSTSLPALSPSENDVDVSYSDAPAAESEASDSFPPAPLQAENASPLRESTAARNQGSSYYPQPDNQGQLPNDITEETYSGAASMNVHEPHDRMANRSRRSSAGDTTGNQRPGIEGIGKPGSDQLSKPQTPSLTIQKSAPAEVQVGKPAKLEVTVKNIGSVAAEEVVIRDEVPAGTRLISTAPAADSSEDGIVLWHMGTIEPNAEVTAMMEVLPIQEGEIGSVASIAFQVSTSSRSMSTRPQLQVEHSGPTQVLVGEDVIFNIKLSNPGTGAAANVVVEEVVPEGLQHYDGRELEYPIGTLRPGETRLLELKLKAQKPGVVENVLVAKADSNIRVEDIYQFEVVAPQLDIKLEGPKRRFLDRKATLQIVVANPGTAPARRVELVAKLPRGVKFLNTNNAGQYDSSRHVVSWNLEELPAGEMGTVEINTNAIELGRQEFRVEAKSASGLADVAVHDIMVEGMAALLFTVTDVNDPIEIGGETAYDVQIINQGSKASTNLRLTAVLPEGMEAVAGEGPTREILSGRTISFEPLARLAPQANAIYKIKVRGTSPGDKRVQIKLVSDEIVQPVTKEESTHVYSDG